MPYGKINNPGGYITKAGRPKGTKNKTNFYLKDVIQKRGRELIEMLFDLAKNGREDVRVKAIGLLLERGYGKPTQEIVGAGGGPVKIEVAWLTEDS